MSHDELTADELLAACACLEAVWADDAAAVEAMLARQPSERPMPLLVALLARALVVMLMSAGLSEATQETEQQEAAAALLRDPTMRVSKVWAESLVEIATTADALQCQAMARSVLNYLLALSPDAGPDDLPQMLTALRQGVLDRL